MYLRENETLHIEFGVLEQFMELGAFSVSLAVADIEASRASKAKFGIEVVGGEVVGKTLGIRFKV